MLENMLEECLLLQSFNKLTPRKKILTDHSRKLNTREKKTRNIYSV
jgi:hypothetical protein